MNRVFSNVIDQYILVYVDNILVYSETTNDHAKHLCEVFPWLHAYKFQAKRANFEFGHA